VYGVAVSNAAMDGDERKGVLRATRERHGFEHTVVSSGERFFVADGIAAVHQIPLQIQG
jgi:hypothetical protein